MIEVTLHHPGGVIDVIEAETVEGAVLGARTIFEDAVNAGVDGSTLTLAIDNITDAQLKTFEKLIKEIR